MSISQNYNDVIKAYASALDIANQRIKALEAQVADLDRRNDELDAEYERMYQLHKARPQWTRITEDKATWPPDIRMVDVLWWDGDHPHLTTCAILRHRIEHMPTHGSWMLASPEADHA